MLRNIAPSRARAYIRTKYLHVIASGHFASCRYEYSLVSRLISIAEHIDLSGGPRHAENGQQGRVVWVVPSTAGQDR